MVNNFKFYTNLSKGYNNSMGWIVGYYVEQKDSNGKIRSYIYFQMKDGRMLFDEVSFESVCTYIDGYPIYEEGNKVAKDENGDIIIRHVFTKDIVKIMPSDDSDDFEAYEDTITDDGFVEWSNGDYDYLKFDDVVWSGGYDTKFEVIGHDYNTAYCKVDGLHPYENDGVDKYTFKEQMINYFDDED